MILLLGLQVLNVASQLQNATGNSSKIIDPLLTAPELVENNWKSINRTKDHHGLGRLGSERHYNGRNKKFGSTNRQFVSSKRTNRPFPLTQSWVQYSDEPQYYPQFGPTFGPTLYPTPYLSFDSVSSPISPVESINPFDSIYIPPPPPDLKTDAGSSKHLSTDRDRYDEDSYRNSQFKASKSEEKTSRKGNHRNGNQKFRNSNQKNEYPYRRNQRVRNNGNNPKANTRTHRIRNNGNEKLSSFTQFDPENSYDEEYDSVIEFSYNPEDPPACLKNSNTTYCIEDNEYPVEAMQSAIDKDAKMLNQIMPDSSETIDLVENLATKEDEKYTYRHYYNGRMDEGNKSKEAYKTSINQDYYKEGGYICPSSVKYIWPRRVMNTNGLWKIVVNLRERYKGADYKQSIRIEECMYPNVECSYTSSYYNSHCIQKFNNHRLLSWTPERGIHLDVFLLPVACSCHFKGKRE